VGFKVGCAFKPRRNVPVLTGASPLMYLAPFNEIRAIALGKAFLRTFALTLFSAFVAPEISAFIEYAIFYTLLIYCHN
jgi:hypothetical protein